MIRSLRSIRTAFSLVVACAAATLGNAIVEGLSNAGFLWRGQYTDGSSWDLAPMGVLTAAASLVTLALLVRRNLDRNGPTVRRFAVRASRSLPARALLRLLPATFAVQLCALWLMETTEQVVVYGRVLGGLLWLGGPIAASLGIHALLCAATAFVLRAVLAAVADGVVRAVRSLRHCAARLRGALVVVGRCDRLRRVVPMARVSALAERGPPRALRAS